MLSNIDPCFVTFTPCQVFPPKHKILEPHMYLRFLVMTTTNRDIVFSRFVAIDEIIKFRTATRPYCFTNAVDSVSRHGL